MFLEIKIGFRNQVEFAKVKELFGSLKNKCNVMKSILLSQLVERN